MIWKQKKEALECHIFLEEKRDLDIKGRIVAGGNKQREYTDKKEASSLASHSDAVFITAAIEASEGRDVAIADLRNAHRQTSLQMMKK